MRNVLKKQKNNGFTLIELLATVVILAIIALIVSTIIIQVIESTKKNSAKQSMFQYVSGFEKYYITELLKNSNFVIEAGEYDINSEIFLNIAMKGEKPSLGYLKITNKGKVEKAELCFFGYLVIYEEDKAIVEKGCNQLISNPTIQSESSQLGLLKTVNIIFPNVKAKYEYMIITDSGKNEWVVTPEQHTTLLITETSKIKARVNVDGKYYESDEHKISFDDTYELEEDKGIVYEIAKLLKNNIPSGDYTINSNGVSYPIEFINYITESQHTIYSTGPVYLGNDVADEKMLVVAYNNLTVDNDVLLTPKVRKKGILIYVVGELTNKGEISMTARGAKASGENVYLWKNDDNSYEYIPANGAQGGLAVSAKSPGTKDWQYSIGNSGINALKDSRQTGGGGSGSAAAYSSATVTSGAGTAGTSYSGGTGGGAITSRIDSSANNGQINGGAGGNGFSKSGTTSYETSYYYSGGGAGNNGGLGYKSIKGVTSEDVSNKGSNGTGGLLIIFASKFTNSNLITSKGSDGGKTTWTTGGSSGGGSINIFANNINLKGEFNVLGGSTNSIDAAYGHGGTGGEGSINIRKIAF